MNRLQRTALTIAAVGTLTAIVVSGCGGGTKIDPSKPQVYTANGGGDPIKTIQTVAIRIRNSMILVEVKEDREFKIDHLTHYGDKTTVSAGPDFESPKLVPVTTRWQAVKSSVQGDFSVIHIIIEDEAGWTHCLALTGSSPASAGLTVTCK